MTSKIGNILLDSQIEPDGTDFTETEKAIIRLMRKHLDNIADSVRQHTVPEGRHLVTRHYVLKAIEFERGRLGQ